MANRGRPIKQGSDADTIARFEAKAVKVFTSADCACILKTRITPLDAYCKHGHALTLKTKKG